MLLPKGAVETNRLGLFPYTIARSCVRISPIINYAAEIDLISLCSNAEIWIIECRARFKHRERTMAYPTTYTSTVAIPLPSEQAVQRMFGKSYDPEDPKRHQDVRRNRGPVRRDNGHSQGNIRRERHRPQDTRDDHSACCQCVNSPYEAQANIRWPRT